MTDLSTSAGVAAILGILFFVGALMFFGYVVPAIIIYWRIFTKAGKPGWYAIVPLYNSVVLAEVAKQPVWMGWTLAGIEAVNWLLVKNSSMSSLLNLVALGLFIYIIVQLSKQFNKDTAFWVLTIILPIVAVFMTGDLKYKNVAPAAPVAAPKS